ncbi:hypothetical protein C8Q80DRAFT_1344072 [Daedaleopsis nitida]|nr:hypothetical protein C8Q80DRAFT_1344072 [Daedaleopsis nitida]
MDMVYYSPHVFAGESYCRSRDIGSFRAMSLYMSNYLHALTSCIPRRAPSLFSQCTSFRSCGLSLHLRSRLCLRQARVHDRGRLKAREQARIPEFAARYAWSPIAYLRAQLAARHRLSRRSGQPTGPSAGWRTRTSKLRQVQCCRSTRRRTRGSGSLTSCVNGRSTGSTREALCVQEVKRQRLEIEECLR